MESICIGITSYNCLDYLRNNVNSIKRAAAGLNVKILVVENGSTDETARWLMEGDFPSDMPNVECHYFINDFNPKAAFGCATSINYFLSQTDSNFFLHLDPDCEIIKKDALHRAILQLKEDPELGAVGEKRYGLRYQHPKSRSLRKFDQYIFGTERNCGHDSEWIARFAPRDGGLPAIWDRTVIAKKVLEKHPTEDHMIYNELCGNVMFFKRKVVEQIGTVDFLRFGMWRWDSEYSMRPLIHGWKIASAQVVEDGSIRHYGGRSRMREKNPDKYDRLVKKDIPS